jgi:DNA integrity scanning protein DisA with diadenylate cyclase activity
MGILLWVNNESFFTIFSIATSIEAILLIPFCLYYFFELLKKPPVLELSKEPSFWIITGILFLLISITPLYLLFKFFKNMPEMGIVDHVGYGIIVVLFTKSITVFKKNT